MRARGWTQNDLARESGLSQPSIHRYKDGATEPRLSDLVAIADAFGVSLDQLTGVNGNSNVLREEGGGYGVKAEAWRERAIAAEKKVETLLSGLETLLKKI